MLNGVFQVMMGQFLLFIGFWFSIATLSDCNFITLLSEDNGDSDGIVVREDGLKSNQIGLLSYLDIKTDQCYYWTNNEVQGLSEPITTYDSIDQIIYYIQDVLGSNWYPVILLCSSATILSFLTFLYIISYCCSTQVRGIRLFIGLFISIIITLLQVIGTYLIYDSNWCNNNNSLSLELEEEGSLELECNIGRSTIFSIVASCCYFLSGLFFIFMSDYPGKKRLNENESSSKNRNIQYTNTGAAAEALPKNDDDDEVVYDEEVGDGGVRGGSNSSASATSNNCTTKEESARLSSTTEQQQREEEEEEETKGTTTTATADYTTTNNNVEEKEQQREVEVVEERKSNSFRSIGSDAFDLPRPPSPSTSS